MTTSLYNKIYSEATKEINGPKDLLTTFASCTVINGIAYSVAIATFAALTKILSTGCTWVGYTSLAAKIVLPSLLTSPWVAIAIVVGFSALTILIKVIATSRSKPYYNNPINLVTSLNAGCSAAELEKFLTAKTMNTILFVKEPEKFGKKKIYSLATNEQKNAPVYQKYGDPTEDGLRHTTSLANIIATNELNYTADEVKKLMRKMMSLKADFSVVDYTNFRGSPEFFSIQNNPLKSLAALGYEMNQFFAFDDIIEELIDYVGKLDVEKSSKILDNVDTYQYDDLSLVDFLLKQGKEKLALKAIEAGAQVTCKTLMLACTSFGTSDHTKTEKGIDCIEMILFKLSLKNKILTKEEQIHLEKSKKRLSFATPWDLFQQKKIYQDKLNRKIVFKPLRDYYMQQKNIDKDDLTTTEEIEEFFKFYQNFNSLEKIFDEVYCFEVSSDTYKIKDTFEDLTDMYRATEEITSYGKSRYEFLCRNKKISDKLSELLKSELLKVL